MCICGERKFYTMWSSFLFYICYILENKKMQEKCYVIIYDFKEELPIALLEKTDD